jgi:RTX calcium-binding nonapeptide repeat (4 copies)
MSTSTWFSFDVTQGSSKSSSHSSVSSEGAGSSATATSTDGTNHSETSTQRIYTPGATSSSGSAIATSSPAEITASTTVSTTVSTDVASQSSDPPADPPLNLFTNLPPPSGSSSSISTIALSPLTINPSSWSKQFDPNGKRLRGRNVNSFLKGGRYNDQLQGGRGYDHLQGKGGNDWLTGGFGHDHLQGGQGDDLLVGGQGDDVLIGSLGQDWLTGGKGADRFVLDRGVTTLRVADVITDFDAAQGDKIQVMRQQNSRAKTLRNIVFQTFDSDGNGSADATLIQSSVGIRAIVLGTVNSSGATSLTYSHLSVLP